MVTEFDFRFLLVIMFCEFQSYLSDAEFERLFHVSKEAFYALPKWKRDQKKKLLDLF